MNPIFIGIGVVGVLALLWIFVGKPFKKASMKTIPTLIAIAMVGAGFFAGGTDSVFNEIKGVTTVSVVTPTVSVTQPVVTQAGAKPICTVEDTSVTFQDRNLYKKGTTVTGSGANRIFIKNYNSVTGTYDAEWSDIGNQLQGYTYNANPYDMLRVIFDFNSTSGTTGAYPHEVVQEIPCTGVLTLTGDVVQYDSSPTITVWNKDGSVNKETNNQSLSADSTYTLPFKISSNSMVCAGDSFHPGQGNELCYQFNSSILDTISILSGGVARASAPVPNALTARAGFKELCFYTDVLCNSAEKEYALYLDTSSGEPYGQNNQINATLWDVSIDVNANTLATLNGVEDENRNDIGMANYIATSNLYIT